MKPQKSSDAPLNPYLAARREWNERYGDYIKTAQTWRVVGLISLVIAAIATAGMAYIGSQNKLVPYVVEVDRLGAARAVSPAQRADRPSANNVRAALGRWVENCRAVSLDAGAQRRFNRECYGYINRRGPAYSQLNDFFVNNDPFKRAETEVVTVEVQLPMPVSDDTWRVEWVETVRGRDGRVLSKTPMQATASLVIQPPTDEATILMNPLGIYVNTFSWSQRL
ncbi:conjugal transfer protein TrbF [Xanthomonas phaseoli]|uniref:conjugal transfer protein TrbF n=1 Tax=Xanthomonas phaseoli TaxID=1985254 RepID=UPI0002D8B669|nr:conjugal transfer protein TrbF [Xanthomonas phaseoli]